MGAWSVMFLITGSICSLLHMLFGGAPLHARPNLLQILPDVAQVSP